MCKKCFKIGAAIASATKAEILLLHVIYTTTGLEKIPERLADYPDVKSAVLKAKNALKNEEQSSILKGVKVTTSVDIGTASPVILFTARKWKADLIIMGSHGMEEASHPLLDRMHKGSSWF